MSRKKPNIEEQFAQLQASWQEATTREGIPIYGRRAEELIAREGVEILKGQERVAGALGVDVKTLMAAKEDPVVSRLAFNSKGRAYIDLTKMSDYDWNSLQFAFIVRERGSERKSTVANERPRRERGKFA
jgi:hypothetical protein